MVVKNVPKPSQRPGPPVRTITKQFVIKKWDAGNQGEKIIIYADTGMGKTTLASLAPGPVFLGLDEGGRKLKHPITNESLNVVEGIHTFQDVRDILQNVDFFADYQTIVIDTVTILQDLAEPWILSNIRGPQGIVAANIESYGYNKGYKHLYNAMKDILVYCDNLVHKGKSIILIAQASSVRISNPTGEDYLRDGLRLHKDKFWDIESLYCEWADHILRIDYQNAFIKDKKVSGDTTRVVHTKQELYFRAKSRTIQEPIISFENQQDDSVWKFMFGDK